MDILTASLIHSFTSISLRPTRRRTYQHCPSQNLELRQRDTRKLQWETAGAARPTGGLPDLDASSAKTCRRKQRVGSRLKESAMTGVGMPVGGRRRADDWFFILLYYWFFPHFFNWSAHSAAPDSLWPQGLQPTRLLSPWDFPGTNAGVGCRLLLQVTEMELIFNTVLASAVQQSESVIHKHITILSGFYSHVGH